MSVNASYRRVTAQGLAELQSDPRRLAKFFGHFEDAYEEDKDTEEDYDAMQDGYNKHLDSLASRGRYLDIMNEHQALNFLLTRQAQGGDLPLGSVVEGGTLFGDIDVGYGPPRVLTPEEVREVAAALAEVTEDDIRMRFDPAAMNAAEVYPASKAFLAQSGWDWNDRERLVRLFQKVKSLFINAAQEGDAIFFWYN